MFDLTGAPPAVTGHKLLSGDTSLLLSSHGQYTAHGNQTVRQRFQGFQASQAAAAQEETDPYADYFNSILSAIEASQSEVPEPDAPPLPPDPTLAYKKAAYKARRSGKTGFSQLFLAPLGSASGQGQSLAGTGGTGSGTSLSGG